jgi:ribose transport system ATP-binding protein
VRQTTRAVLVSSSEAPIPLVSLRNLSKTFGPTPALRGVDLDLYGHEVHALIGQNGSGKSTLIKILSGYHAPDAGARLLIRGEEVELPLTAARAGRLGLAFLHQDMGMAATLSVLENLMVNRYETGALWRVRWSHERRRATSLLSRFGLDLDPDLPVRHLSRGEQALLGIVRAFAQMEQHGGGIMVLDEPTAALPGHDVERLFAVLREISAQGSGAVIVSHRLDEVKAIADRVSVLRDGWLVASVRAGEADSRQFVEYMLGPGALVSHAGERSSSVGDDVLRVSGLSGRQLLSATFSVRRGEIVGVTGLTGMGQDEIPYLLCGASRRMAGDVVVEDTALRGSHPAEAFRAGLAILPQDRQRQGGFASATIAENITASVTTRYFKRGWMQRKHESADVKRSLGGYQVVPNQPNRIFRAFSGGNQQKALLARIMETSPKVVVLHEPTQGVDVGSRQHILAAIARSAEQATGVLLVSIEYADLARLCHRVLVVSRGRVASELQGAEISERAIAHACYAAAEDVA